MDVVFDSPHLQLLVGNHKDARQAVDVDAVIALENLTDYAYGVQLNMADERPAHPFLFAKVPIRTGRRQTGLQFLAALAVLDDIVQHRRTRRTRDQQRAPKLAVLIHCQAGHQRAPTLAACWLVARGHEPNLLAAWETITKARPGTAPEPSNYVAAGECLQLWRTIHHSPFTSC